MPSPLGTSSTEYSAPETMSSNVPSLFSSLNAFRNKSVKLSYRGRFLFDLTSSVKDSRTTEKCRMCVIKYDGGYLLGLNSATKAKLASPIEQRFICAHHDGVTINEV